MGQPLRECLADDIIRMDRPELVRLLMDMPCRFRLDFSPEYLDALGLDQLRHVALAASLHLLQDGRQADEP